MQVNCNSATAENAAEFYDAENVGIKKSSLFFFLIFVLGWIKTSCGVHDFQLLNAGYRSCH